MNTSRFYASIFAGSLLLALPASATLTLTPVGVSDGFSLSTFVSGYPPATYGPLSVGVLPGGNLITGSYANSALYIFADADGQCPQMAQPFMQK